MKKILMTLAAVAMAATMNAQGYIGGTMGIGSMKVGDADAETTYKFLPEVGYNINSDWAVGVAFGWTKGDLQVLKNNLNVEGFRTTQVNPYVRYTFVHSKYFNVFSDLGLSYAHINGAGDAFKSYPFNLLKSTGRAVLLRSSKNPELVISGSLEFNSDGFGKLVVGIVGPGFLNHGIRLIGTCSAVLNLNADGELVELAIIVKLAKTSRHGEIKLKDF